MKNRFYYLVLIAFLISCQDEQDLKKPSKSIQVADGRLKFLDEDHLLETVLSVQRGNTDVIDGRILGLEYISYYSTLDDPQSTSEELQVLDLYEFRLLLNHEREIQVGDKVYSISNKETRIYDLTKKLLEIEQNEVSYYNRESKSFESKDMAAGKVFGGVYSESFGYEIDGSTQFGVRYTWLRVSGFGLKLYYYQTSYYRPLSTPAPTAVEYFERDISDCEASSCDIQPTNPYGGIHYNVTTVKYACGGNTNAHEAVWGAWLRAAYWVKPYNKDRRYVYHVDDLEIP